MSNKNRDKSAFRTALAHWHEHHNFRTYPWTGEKDPYKIWLSEILLQQTRAEQGLPYYEKFVAAFPAIEALAAAPDDKVMKLWEGLGYYARCRNMLATARQIVAEKGGVFPNSYEGLLKLKGIGPYTAAAIAAFAFDLPHAVVDGNVYRVLARYFGITEPTDSTVGKKRFQSLANEVLDHQRPGEFNQGLMDFGASVCTPSSPQCSTCPVAKGCMALRDSLTELLPVKAKKVAVRTRHFHYLLLYHNDSVWIRKRSGKDIWHGLYEPWMLEAIDAFDEHATLGTPAFQSLGLKKVTLQPEGEWSQRLTHQIIHTRIFSAIIDTVGSMPEDGLWVPVAQLQDYPFPRGLITFLQKKRYF